MTSASVLGAVCALGFTLVVDAPAPVEVQTVAVGPVVVAGLEEWREPPARARVAPAKPKPQPPVKPAKQKPKPEEKLRPKPKPPPKVKPVVDERECSSALDGTLPHVARAGHHLAGKFGVATVYGRHGRAGRSEHPSGRALDFMVDEETGDRLTDYVLDHRAELAVMYVIWKQRINSGTGWRRMEDRGNPTANHYDHVHVSFREKGGGGGLPC